MQEGHGQEQCTPSHCQLLNCPVEKTVHGLLWHCHGATRPPIPQNGCPPDLVWLQYVSRPTPLSLCMVMSKNRCRSSGVMDTLLSTHKSSLAAPDTRPRVASRPKAPHGGFINSWSCSSKLSMVICVTLMPLGSYLYGPAALATACAAATTRCAASCCCCGGCEGGTARLIF